MRTEKPSSWAVPIRRAAFGRTDLTHGQHAVLIAGVGPVGAARHGKRTGLSRLEHSVLRGGYLLCRVSLAKGGLDSEIGIGAGNRGVGVGGILR